MSFTVSKNSRTIPKVNVARKRASHGKNAKGGSVYKKLVNGRVQAKMSIVAGFLEKHKLGALRHVMLKFNAKTKVLAVEFLKAASPGCYSVDHDAKSGTAFISLTQALRNFGVQLSESLYNEEYVFDKSGNMLVDLSDNIEKAVEREIKRDKNGRLASLTKSERAKRVKQAEESFGE